MVRTIQAYVYVCLGWLGRQSLVHGQEDRVTLPQEPSPRLLSTVLVQQSGLGKITGD